MVKLPVILQCARLDDGAAASVRQLRPPPSPPQFLTVLTTLLRLLIRFA